MVENDHSWKQCAGISKGGARSMTEKTGGSIAHVKAIATPAAENIANQLEKL
jgi:hypothetical protein